MSRSITVEAPAKINLGLHVLARETTGYHSLETLFCAISLSDQLVLELTGRTGIDLEVSGRDETGPPAKNLVVKAANAFYDALGEPAGVRINLRKRIPSAAGLGGGSSDAAATLAALNLLHDSPLTRAQLLQIGIEIGADVPFFLCGSPLALAWGRGERLLSLPPLAPRPVLVAHSGQPMPTGDMFSGLADRRREAEPRAFCLDSEVLGDWDAIARMAENDFQPLADERLPQLASARKVLRDAGAFISMLAGSGSAVFGVFESSLDMENVIPTMEAHGFETWRATSLAAMPESSLRGFPASDP